MRLEFFQGAGPALNFLASNARPIVEAFLLIIVVWHMFHTTGAVRTLEKEFASLRFSLSTVVDKVDQLNRAELLQQLSLTAKEAEQSIVHYTYTFHLPAEEPEMGPLLEAIRTSTIPKIEYSIFLGSDLH